MQAASLESVYQQYQQSKDWANEQIGLDLKSLVASTSGNALLTAKSLLVGHLMEKGGGNNYNSALTTATAIIQSNSGTWQAVLASIDKAAILGFLNQQTNSLQAAQEGLNILNSVQLNDLNDPFFVQFLTATASDRSDFKDALLSIIARIYIDQNNGPQADVYINQIADTAVKSKDQRLRNRIGQ